MKRPDETHDLIKLIEGRAITVKVASKSNESKFSKPFRSCQSMIAQTETFRINENPRPVDRSILKEELALHLQAIRRIGYRLHMHGPSPSATVKN